MKRTIIAVFLMLTSLSLYAKGLQDETYAGASLGLRDYKHTSDNGTLFGLKGRYVASENLDVLGSYQYEKADFDGFNLKTNDFEIGADCNFLPKQEFNPFAGASFHYLTFGGDSDADNTQNWDLRGGLEINLIDNWSVTPALIYAMDEDFENGLWVYDLTVHKWLDDSIGIQFGLQTNEDSDYTDYRIGVNMAL